MAKFKTGPLNGQGFDMLTDLVITDLEDYDHLKTSPSAARFFDNSKNFVEFGGSGFKYNLDDGFLIDVRGGTIKSLTVKEQGDLTVSISGLKLSASKVFDFYINDDTTGAREYLTKGNDTISGTRFDDRLIGGAGKDHIDGGDGDDQLLGSNGNDTLRGSDGNDLLSGEQGDDTLSGGKGADIFYFAPYPNLFPPSPGIGGVDTIVDFSSADGDKIRLSALDALTGASASNDAFIFIGPDEFTLAGQLRAYHDGADTFVEGDSDGDGVAEFTIRLKGLYDLVSSDFDL